MEKETDNSLYKSRSYSAAINAGYRLYTGNFKKLLRFSWLPAFFYAVVCGALGTLCVIQMPRLLSQLLVNIGDPTSFAQSYGITILLILTLAGVGGILEILFYSYGMTLLKKHSLEGVITIPVRWLTFDRKTAWRTLKGACALLVLTAVPLILLLTAMALAQGDLFVNPGAHLLTWGLASLVTLIILLSYLPLSYILMKYVLNDGTRFWPLLAKEYHIGLRHFGFIFVVVFISLIVILVSQFVIQQPAFILSQANWQAQMGVVYGDPIGMPDYITYLTAAIFLITGFMQAYIRVTMLFTCYYMYGSIEQQEEERRQFDKKLN